MRSIAKKIVAAGIAAVVTLGVLAVPSAMAGSAQGRTVTNEQVFACDTDTYRVRFYADDQALVAAKGDGDIDLFIYDEEGNLVTKDTRTDRVPVCTFQPSELQTFIIKVKNCKSYAVDYRLVTN